LLVGDACGVPYEFRRPEELPPTAQLGMIPPKGFIRSYAHIPLGTWSDDGAQALCLLESLIHCRGYHAFDFSRRLLRWHDEGHMAVDHYVFDIGNQTSESILRLKQGQTTDHSGLKGVRNNGNGSLMRVLPLVLVHDGKDEELVVNAHRQSKLTHGHIRSQICCALYCLWAKRELEGCYHAWDDALDGLFKIYESDRAYLHELDAFFGPNHNIEAKGSGYVVDSLHSARIACEEPSYEAIIRRAIAFGNDTDTTAAIAGGIAGIRHGKQGIPADWLSTLRGQEIFLPLLNNPKLRRAIVFRNSNVPPLF
jgi:ADP-ribosyl-[dinitrogen reductase] hydrolase